MVLGDEKRACKLLNVCVGYTLGEVVRSCLLCVCAESTEKGLVNEKTGAKFNAGDSLDVPGGGLANCGRPDHDGVYSNPVPC